MAGKKRSNNTARKAQYTKRCGSMKKGNKKQYGGRITAENKMLKGIRTQTHNEKLAKRINILEDLKKQVAVKFELKTNKDKYALKRLIGTINISRLKNIISGKYKNAKWFHTRRALIKPVDINKSEENIVHKTTNASKVIRSTQLGALLH